MAENNTYNQYQLALPERLLPYGFHEIGSVIMGAYMSGKSDITKDTVTGLKYLFNTIPVPDSREADVLARRADTNLYKKLLLADRLKFIETNPNIKSKDTYATGERYIKDMVAFGHSRNTYRQAEEARAYKKSHFDIIEETRNRHQLLSDPKTARKTVDGHIGYALHHLLRLQK